MTLAMLPASRSFDPSARRQSKGALHLTVSRRMAQTKLATLHKKRCAVRMLRCILLSSPKGTVSADRLLNINRRVQGCGVSLQQVRCDAYGPARHDVNVADTLVKGFIRTEEGLVAYWATAPPGPGTDTLLLPGLGCPWFLMAPLAVATGRKCLIFALPGTSGTDLPASGYTLDGVGRMMKQACERLEVSPSALIGHSLGALVASSLLSDCSFPANRVLLLCPPGETLHQVLRGEEMGVPLGARLQASLGLLGMIASTHMPSWLAQLVLTSAPRYNPVLRYCFADAGRLSERDLHKLAREMTAGPVLETLKQARGTDTREIVQSVKAPCRIAVFADRDPLIPVRDAAAFTDKNKGWHSFLVSPGAHWLPFEHPRCIAQLLEEAGKAGS